MTKVNRSKTYLLPLIADSIGVDTKYLNLIQNTYICDALNNYPNCFIIEHLFPINRPDMIKYENQLMSSELFIKHFDFNEKVLYLYNFPQDYMFEYLEFKNSRYSTFGEDAKSKILKYWTLTYGSGLANMNFLTQIKKILYKSEELRKKYEKDLNVKISPDQELGEYIDLNDETIIIYAN